ncbi:MAG: tRNA guanosine(15) transglycosylase TgtA [Candidatus Thermoplasmatota archaeon]|nr:tRNA guanosine(15) transglycosylase TgtA [Candidatus Thermoplasmatota archaeon]
MFEIKERDAAGRICHLETAHGKITTPTVLPVINPGYTPVTPNEMRKMGAQAIITNAYIIYKNEKFRTTALKKGVHKLVDFSGPIMTDSGSFQMYMYGAQISPLKIVEFQRDIGSDIGTILDLFSLNATKHKAIDEVKETVKRARASVPLKGKMMLACTVQGGIYKDLRYKCASEMKKIDADIHPIGGVVPLMEQQKYRKLAEVIIASKKGLPPSRPVHLFGAGHPVVFPIAVALGCNLFDSAAYIKYANDRRMLFPDGTMKLDGIEESPCSCEVCRKYSVKELREMEEKERTKKLAYHNLYQTFVEMKRIREAIRGGWLLDLVEKMAISHPSLLDVMQVIKGEKRWLEKWEPISKKRAFFYTGRYAMHRPVIYRFQKRLLERFSFFYPDSVILEEKGKPYLRYYRNIRSMAANFVVDSKMGLVPAELEEMYPVAQSIFSDTIDVESKRIVRAFNKKFMEKVPNVIGISEVKKGRVNFDLHKLMAVADMQFGKGAGKALFDGNVRVVKSKKTGKIRNVYCDEKHVVSMRATDGLFTLKIAGAELLHDCFKHQKLRIVVADNAVPFIGEGKNVFAKFVLECDEELRPYDEALIVSEEDELVAAGQCRMNREEMLSFERGIAVKTRS